MKVLRLTRHPASEEQLAELRRIYGEDVQVSEHPEIVSDAARVREIVSAQGADVLEAVLPLPLMAACLDPRNGVGVPVIRTATRRELKEDGSAVFHFLHYERVVKIEITTERL